MQTRNSLEQLLNERGDLWRGRRRQPAAALPTGRAALDARLPDGGWPRGKLTELLPECVGAGELELLLPCLAGLTRREQPVLFIAPPLIPCPQSLIHAGLDLARLVVIRDAQHAFWAAEQCLKSGLCGAVVAWPATDRVDDRAVRRLQLAAENGEAPIFLCYEPGCRPPPSLASLRLSVRSGGDIDLLRSRGGHATGTIRRQTDNVIPMTRRDHAVR